MKRKVNKVVDPDWDQWHEFEIMTEDEIVQNFEAVTRELLEKNRHRDVSFHDKGGMLRTLKPYS